MERAQLLQRMLEGRVRWEDALARVPEDRLEDPILDQGWSVKDVIAHIGAWENVAADRIEYGLGARDAPPEHEGLGFDDRNAIYRKQHRGQSLDVVRAEEAGAWARLRSLVESLSEEQLNHPDAFERGFTRPAWQTVAGNTYEHYDEHIAQIGQGLDRGSE